MIEVKEIVYAVGGLALLGLTALPLIGEARRVPVPLLYAGVGALLAALPLGWPSLDPREGLGRLVLLQATELLVIVSVAGAGLAIDRREGRREWQHTWALLGLAMPLTLAALLLLGLWAGMGLASALLMAAVLSPTDPVLAREVQTPGPNEGDEDDVRVALTAEAGLNDSLAFPFVWLAIGIAVAAAGGEDFSLGRWLLNDGLWRAGIAVASGWALGAGAARFALGPWGDRQLGGRNAGLVLLGSVLLVYGATEMLDGYGFLAVFVAARMARASNRAEQADSYTSKPHRYADQFEKILLAFLLLWLGGFAVTGVLEGLHWREVTVALLLVLAVRPLAGVIALAPTRGDAFERSAMALFGLRGMASLFYLCFAVGHAAFPEADSVWRVGVISILLSMMVHGMLAPPIMRRISRRIGRKEADLTQASNAAPGG